MKAGIPKEVFPGERRVAATPASVEKLIALGFEVAVERGAGEGASFFDSAYEEAGATMVDSVWADADVVLKVRPPRERPDGKHEADLIKEGATLISLLFPAQNAELIERIAKRKATVLALDAIPRITRAQKMDVLSSMANIAGYRAVIEAAEVYGGFFAGQMTAAGKTPPAHVLVIGAGVAGLAAIAAARGLGAVVRAFDTRPAVKEQVQSLGGEFLELQFEESGEGGGGYAKVMSKEFIDAEMALFREQAPKTDIIITTALIPGKKAPLLVPKDVVELMKPGSVVIDLAAEQGGNCEFTKADEVVDHGGVKIVGYTDLTSRLANTASLMFATNVYHLLDELGGAEGYHIDEDDEAVRGALVLNAGELRWPPPKKEAPPPKTPKPTEEQRAGTKHDRVSPPPPPQRKPVGRAVAALVAAVGLAGLAFYAPSEFLQHFTVFVLACFVGWQVIWNVTPALHTPLMSVTNAISGIILVGGILKAGGAEVNVAAILGTIAVLVASINVVGGFFVTQRMLQMFRK